MKKISKSIVKQYGTPRNSDPAYTEYYGLMIKDNRVKIDTKRYKKFFELPDQRIEIRNTVYYEPSRQHKLDYYCNFFRTKCELLKQKYNDEFKVAIEAIKTPKQVEDNARVQLLNCGESFDTASEKAILKGIKRINPYKYAIKSLYAQFYHQMMAEIDAQTCRVMIPMGFRENDFNKKSFDIFIQSKQGPNSKPFKNFKYYYIYDRAYSVWNFLKHNSKKAYDILCKFYPETIYDPENNYKNGDLALSVLKLDEKFILNVLKELPMFFDEVCEIGLKENTNDALWDYDDYFLNQVNKEINSLNNPLDD